MCVDVSLPLRHRLDTLQKEFNLYGQQPSKQLDNPEIDGMDVNSLQFETSVIDGPIINTRAGLYVYLNSMVWPFLIGCCGNSHSNIHIARGTSLGRRLHPDQLPYQSL